MNGIGAFQVNSNTLASLFDVNSDTQFIFYASAPDSAYGLSFVAALGMHPGQPPWTQAMWAGPPIGNVAPGVTGFALAGNTMSGWVSTSDKNQHIAFISDGVVSEVYRDPTQSVWSADNPSISAEAPAAGWPGLTSWVSPTDNLQHIAYIDANGNVQELYKHPGDQPWSWDEPSRIAGAPGAQGGALTSWFSTTDNMQHIAYIDSGGHVQELYMHPGQQPWNWDEPSRIAGAPGAQGGALTSWVSTTDNMQHIAYIDSGGFIEELYMHPGQQPWAYDLASANPLV